MLYIHAGASYFQGSYLRKSGHLLCNCLTMELKEQTVNYGTLRNNFINSKR